MTKPDPKKIIKALPQHYYVIEIKNRMIVDTNDPDVKIGETFCFKHFYSLDKPCNLKETNFECTCHEVITKNSYVEIDQICNTPKGFRAYHVKANPIENADGKITHIITQYTDIKKQVELKKNIEAQNLELKTQNEEYLAANEELREQKEEYETLYEELKEANREIKKSKDEIEGLKLFFENINEAVQDGIWVTDKNDVIFYANPGMEKISGVSRLEMINKNVLKDLPPETSKEIIPFYKKAKKQLEPVWYEIRVKTPNGKNTYQNG